MIRQALSTDMKSIRMSLLNKGIHYISPKSATEDFQHGSLFVLEENGKLIGQCALKYTAEHGKPYYAIQRMTVYNKKNKGYHLAEQFISYFENMGFSHLGISPWAENVVVKNTIKRHGFTYQYQFHENYEFWTKDYS